MGGVPGTFSRRKASQAPGPRNLERYNMDTERQFEGKIAIVTGSTQGLGEATARLFAERGARGIVITGRDETRGEAVAASLDGASCRAVFVRADMASVEDCRALVAAADEAFGTVHVLVNSAGATTRGSILNTTPEVYDQVMAVNVRAPFFLTAGNRQDHGPRGCRRFHRQHRQRFGLRRHALPLALLHLERRPRRVDQERRLRAHAPPHPGQRPQHRLDGHARRRHDPAHRPRQRRELVGRRWRRDSRSGDCSRRARSPRPSPSSPATSRE